MQLSFLPPVIYFSFMHLLNKFYPLAPNQETNRVSAILEKYIGGKCIWWTFIKHQWGPLWHARLSGHEEHEFAAGLSIAQGPPVATREKEVSSGICSRMKIGKKSSKKKWSIFTADHGTLAGWGGEDK